MSSGWFFFQNGNNKGPYTLDQLKSLVNANKVFEDDTVFDPIKVVWVKASDVPDLFDNAGGEDSSKVTYSNDISRFNLTKNKDIKNFNQTLFSIGNQIRSIATKSYQHTIHISTIVYQTINSLASNLKSFLKTVLVIWIGLALGILVLSSFHGFLPTILKIGLIGISGPVTVFQLIKFGIVSEKDKTKLLRLALALSTSLGLIFVNLLGGFFSTVWFFVLTYLIVLGIAFFFRQMSKPAFICFVTSAAGLLLTLIASMYTGQNAFISPSVFNTSSLDKRIFGKWKKEGSIIVIFELTSGGSFIFDNETRRYKISNKNEIQIVNNSSYNLVDETLIVDFRNDNEIIIVNSHKVGIFSIISGRFIKSSD